MAVRPAAGRRAARDDRAHRRCAVAPLIRRRQALVDAREASWARLSGHVADTLTNMDAVRAYAAGAPRGRRAPAARRRPPPAHAAVVGLRQPAHRHARRAAVGADQRGRAAARRRGGEPEGAAGVAAVVVTFAYYVQATRILFEFNQIYRQLERSLTEAAQFTELLLDPPTVLDPESPGAAAPARAASVRLSGCGSPTRAARAAVRRARPAHRRRRAGRPGRPVRRRQDVDHPAAAAADGRRRRPDPDRRPGHHPAVAGRPAQPDRLRPAGPGDVPPDARGEHRVRPAGRDRRRDPGGGRGGARHRVRRRAAAAASTRWSASAA